MGLKLFGIGALTRAMAATAVIGTVGLMATSAYAALSSTQLADANMLAELIVNAAQQANATPDNPNTGADETRAAIQDAIETTIEGFQNGEADPGVVSEAMFLAKAKMVGSGGWCPQTLATTKPSMKSRAAPELEHTCSMSAAFASVLTAVQTAQNSPPSSTEGPPSTNSLVPQTGGGGGGGSVYHPPGQ